MKVPKRVAGILFPLAAFAVFALLYVVIFGKPTLIVWRMKKEAAKNPELAVVPVPLTNTSISQDKGATEEFFGYEFEVPWQDTEANQHDSVVVVGSERNGAGMSFFDPAGEF
jgi:hypothetical protein